MNREAVTLIFDIGKTTKKVLLFDQDFHVVDEQTERLPEVPDDDGFPGEDIDLLSKWVLDAIDRYQQHQKYVVTHMNFSAYGASLVHLDKKGEIMPRLYNYLKPLPDDCKEIFLKAYNRNNDLSTTTASPFLGLLNSGLQLFWLRHKKKEFFDHIQTSLHFPQYFTYLISRKKFSDITSVGCHTMLWDFGKKDYHEWVTREAIRGLLPPLCNADFKIDHAWGETPVKMGIGVHDSSAALMPYLTVMKEKFLLLSTGTWNICFNPFNHELLTQDELSQDCLCFLTFDGKPVKASRIFLGHEHELQQNAMAAYFGVHEDYYKSVDFNPDLYTRIKDQPANFKILGMQGTGPAIVTTSSSTDYSVCHGFEAAQHLLIRQLVLWQKISIDLIDPEKKVKKIIVVGGFTKSKLFLEIMKRELSERKILVSDHPRASALGAAWLVNEKNDTDKHKVLNVLEA